MNVKKGFLRVGIVVLWALFGVGLINGTLWLWRCGPYTDHSPDSPSPVDNPLSMFVWVLVAAGSWASLCILVGVGPVLLTVAVAVTALLIYVMRGFTDPQGRLMKRQQREIIELKHLLSDYQGSGQPGSADRIQDSPS
ncbi:MAG: hypothetical protein ABFE13_15380 [Phycisphaerales bacterium]